MGYRYIMVGKFVPEGGEKAYGIEIPAPHMRESKVKALGDAGAYVFRFGQTDSGPGIFVYSAGLHGMHGGGSEGEALHSYGYAEFREAGGKVIRPDGKEDGRGFAELFPGMHEGSEPVYIDEEAYAVAAVRTEPHGEKQGL